MERISDGADVSGVCFEPAHGETFAGNECSGWVAGNNYSGKRESAESEERHRRPEHRR